jgi:gamma-glutamyltranspeptidase/glutathione hydrolase
MIAPTIARHRDGRIVALGSGGSNRIRSAVARVLVGVIRGATIEQAVAAPRVHAEDSSGKSEVWIELADLAEPDVARLALAGEFGVVHDFAQRDFFFGGVHTVELDPQGRLRGVGDGRRFGVTRMSP